MTPEEQFQKIENALRHTAELGAQHEERLTRNEAEIEKVSAAVRDLVVISRTLVDSQSTLGDSQSKLVDSQRKLIDSQSKLVDSQSKIVDSQGKIENSHRGFYEIMEALAEERRQANLDFKFNLNALIQAQMETEQKLQRWIDRQQNGHGH